MQISADADDLRRNAAKRAVCVGDRVRVRRQRWMVDDIRPHEDCSIVTLAGLEPANFGLHQQVLMPFDDLEPLATKRSFRIVTPKRWRRECRQLLADAGPAGILHTARTADMDLLPHQLEPALAIVQGRGVRVLIADEVGLGKTVQAGLIVAELRTRGAATRVLVLAPAGLREQWVDELARRFNLQLTLFDAASVARRRRTLPVGINPWSIEPLIISSLDYVKRPEVCPAIEACRWDVVVVDEAHHVTDGSDRHDAVNALCSNAPYAVLLTATPHNGDPRAFSSLCAIGGHDDRLLIFRRTREQIGFSRDRHVHQLRVRPTAAERAMHGALDRFVRAVQQEPGGRDSGTWLALSTLRKRALSSAFALQRSVEQRLDSLCSSGFDDGCPRQLALPLADAGEFNQADEAPPWLIPAMRDAGRERRLLTDIAAAAAQAFGSESKLNALTRLLRRVRQPVIVFTEYRDTLAHLVRHVAPGATVLHGGMSRDERRLALTRFEQGGVLLATDAAGEGLNLHQRCRLVVNLELPWNPTRLEQRIGRVDRIGQTRRVHAFHLIAAGTTEMRVLQRLGSRVARARADVGASDPLRTASVESPILFESERLTTEAQQEHDRLTFARKLTVYSTPARSSVGVSRHVLVTFSKRRALRKALKSDALILFRSDMSQLSGQEIAYQLVPVRIQGTPFTEWRFSSFNTLGHLLGHDWEFHKWLAATVAVHASFWTIRLQREQQIAGRAHAVPSELQPGLFDARAVHAWRDDDEARRTAARRHASEVSAASLARGLTLHAPEVALVMLP